MRGFIVVIAVFAALSPFPAGVGHAQVSPTSPAYAQPSKGIVKLSRNGICHPPGGAFYSRTKHYTAHASMRACIAAGGRPAKR